jgi:hypothetical protein
MQHEEFLLAIENPLSRLGKSEKPVNIRIARFNVLVTATVSTWTVQSSVLVI